MGLFACETVGGGVGPYIVETLVVCQLCHRLAVVALALVGQCTVETALVSPLQADGGL